MKRKVLGMVFTYPVSLEDWVKLGLLDREKMIYEEHLRKGNFEEVVWFTFGTNDGNLRDDLVSKGLLDSRIKVCCAPNWAKKNHMRLLYSFLIPIVHCTTCKKLSIVKSNQMGGARVAAAIAKKNRIPFEFRTGYTYSIFRQKKLRSEKSIVKRIKGSFWLRYYKVVEAAMYKKCDFAVVSSEADRQYIIREYGISEDKIQILTNYIDCTKFQPTISLNKKRNRFVFVGRLTKQKNLKSLIEAFTDIDVGLDIYGDGEQREELQKIVDERGVDVVLKGRVSNDDLPSIYNDYKYFILPSFYEGMPKTLLEAMACGCVCFGTKVEGNKEVIRDKYTGYIIDGTKSEDISKVVIQIIHNREEDLSFISENSRKYVLSNHSLEKIAEIEHKLISNLRI